MNEISISFIIPVLNAEKYIEKCLNAILCVKFINDEIIIVDNGSTDETLSIAKKYDKIRILSHPRTTIAFLRNSGAKVASGNVLAFIDADCTVCDGWREAVCSTLDNETQATGSRCQIPQASKWIEKAWYSQRAKSKGPASYINSGNLVVRADAFWAVGGFDENLTTDEDGDFGARFAARGFLMLENPDVKTIHLGNPKTLWAFYKKERWHAINMLSSLKRKEIDKATIMTMVFMAFLIMGLIFVIAFHSNPFSIIIALAAIWFVPVLTALVRALKFKCYRYILPLSVLFLLFYSARVSRVLYIAFAVLSNMVQEKSQGPKVS
jgi:glycosyltransferase involved in cell wall biosynthesis